MKNSKLFTLFLICLVAVTSSCTSESNVSNDIDVTPEIFLERWNSVISEVGKGDLIDKFDQVEDVGGDRAYAPLGSFGNLGFLEVLIDSDGYIEQILLFGNPETDEQVSDLMAMSTALVAGVTGYGPDKAFNVAFEDLSDEKMVLIFLRQSDYYQKRIETEYSVINIQVMPTTKPSVDWEVFAELRRR